MNSLSDFNLAQREAITHFEGPALVVAGPGSGKTTVLTHRIKYLVEERRVPPDRILVITFTKAAAAEMQSRFMKLCNEQRVMFGTFHSVFYYILKQSSGEFLSRRLISPKEKHNYIRHILTELGCRKDASADVIEGILSEMSRIKNIGGFPQDYSCRLAFPSAEDMRRIYRRYTELCREEERFDYDDILLSCRELLLGSKELLKKWQSRFRFILVDEYQDINPVQNEILELLAFPENNLFCVGDDDQSIYGFRGAGTEIMLSFDSRHKDAVRIDLDINYRSLPQIVISSGRVIACNKKRLKKNIKSAQTAAVEDCVVSVGTGNVPDQYEMIADCIKKAGSYSECAILLRTSADFEKAVRALRVRDIPANVCGNIAMRPPGEVMEDFFAYVRCSLAKPFRKDFYRIMNRPDRGLLRSMCPEERVSLLKLKLNTLDFSYTHKAVLKLEKDLRVLEGLSPVTAADYFLKVIGYEKYYLELNSSPEARQKAKEEIEFFVQEASGRTDLAGWLKEADDNQKTSETVLKDKAGVHIMTYHASKGLEFDTVFLPELNEKKVPHSKASTDEQVEEERRMFYVAMTRAKRRLFLVYVRPDSDDACRISRFIKNMGGTDQC